MDITGSITAPSTPFTTVPSNITISNDVIEVRGQCFSAQYILPMTHLEDGLASEEQIKKHLVSLLINQMYKDKHIEFTMERDVVNDRMITRARMYVVPDTIVRLLRLNRLIK